MSDFDPDAYLAKKSDGFDPDAYLAKHEGKEIQGPMPAVPVYHEKGLGEQVGEFLKESDVPGMINSGLNGTLANGAKYLPDVMPSPGVSEAQRTADLNRDTHNHPIVNAAGMMVSPVLGAVGKALNFGKAATVLPEGASLGARALQVGKDAVANGLRAIPSNAAQGFISGAANADGDLAHHAEEGGKVAAFAAALGVPLSVASYLISKGGSSLAKYLGNSVNTAKEELGNAGMAKEAADKAAKATQATPVEAVEAPVGGDGLETTAQRQGRMAAKVGRDVRQAHAILANPDAFSEAEVAAARAVADKGKEGFRGMPDPVGASKNVRASAIGENTDVMRTADLRANMKTPARPAIPESIAKIREKIKAAKEAIALEAQNPGPFKATARDGKKVFVSPDPSKPGQWRTTWFSAEGEPIGHLEAADKAGALERARDYGVDFTSDMTVPKRAPEALVSARYPDMRFDNDPERLKRASEVTVAGGKPTPPPNRGLPPVREVEPRQAVTPRDSAYTPVASFKAIPADPNSPVQSKVENMVGDYLNKIREENYQQALKDKIGEGVSSKMDRAMGAAKGAYGALAANPLHSLADTAQVGALGYVSPKAAMALGAAKGALKTVKAVKGGVEGYLDALSPQEKIQEMAKAKAWLENPATRAKGYALIKGLQRAGAVGAGEVTGSDEYHPNPNDPRNP